MSVQRVESTEIVNLPALLEDVETHHSRALVKTNHFEAILVQLAQGQTMEAQNAPAPFIVQGISGTVRFNIDGTDKDVSEGDWMHISKQGPNTVVALSDCSFLLTMLFVY